MRKAINIINTQVEQLKLLVEATTDLKQKVAYMENLSDILDVKEAILEEMICL